MRLQPGWEGLSPGIKHDYMGWMNFHGSLVPCSNALHSAKLWSSSLGVVIPRPCHAQTAGLPWECRICPQLSPPKCTSGTWLHLMGNTRGASVNKGFSVYLLRSWKHTLVMTLSTPRSFLLSFLRNNSQILIY